MVKKTVQLFADTLLQSLQTAEQAFLSQANGRTVCEIGKSGGESLQLKAAEGRMQALRDIERIVRNTAGNADELLYQLQQLDERWQQFSEISASWEAYKNAGLAEIGSSLEAVEQFKN